MQKIAIFLIFASVLAQIQTKPTTKPLHAGYTPIHKILDMFPFDKIQEIEQEHLKNDDGFRAAVLYLQGPEWTQLVENAMKSAEYRKFVEMADKFHLNLTQAIRCLKDHIKSLKVIPTKVTSKPNLAPFIQDVERVIPMAEIVSKLSDPRTWEEAREFRNQISSPENRKIANDLYASPAMVKLRDTLKEMNLYVEPYIALVYSLLGWVVWKI